MKGCPIRGCCAHLLQYKTEHGLQTLLTIRRYAELTERGRAASMGLPSPKCMTCGNADNKLFACLSCVHIACQDDTLLHYKMFGHALRLLFIVFFFFFFSRVNFSAFCAKLFCCILQHHAICVLCDIFGCLYTCSYAFGIICSTKQCWNCQT